jgi:transketolase
MEDLERLARLVRYYCLLSTSTAGSGHLTSSLSAADLMTVLFFGGFLKFDTKNPQSLDNDRIVFSKGHASSLFYSLWAVAGELEEKELLEYRKFGSSLEGHPTLEFKFTEAPTGSLGQGLSIGLGMALASKIDKKENKIFVLLGDGEMAEGQVWEAIQLTSYYGLNNLIAVIDVNRLGQNSETMIGWDVKKIKHQLSSFGWETIITDGHDLGEISRTYSIARSSHLRPVAIIAKTIKGKGIKSIENKEGFHGKALPYDKIGEYSSELGDVEKELRGTIAKPELQCEYKYNFSKRPISHVAQYKIGENIATRQGFGYGLLELPKDFPSVVVLDAEVSNSTYSDKFRDKFPEKFLDMFIAEQNMVSVAVGFARFGKMPFVSTFSAFLTRAHDQLRMAAYSKANIKFVGSHSGVSVGEDGASQMGLEDIAMFRSLFGSVILYPSDAESAKKLVYEMAKHEGLVYLRITRSETPIIYSEDEKFEIGGSKTLKSSGDDKFTIVSAGITLHEALKAHEMLKEEGINTRVIDLYSIKPIDTLALQKAAVETGKILVVEDNYPEGGIGEAVRTALSGVEAKIYSLAVSKMPRSGKAEELLDYEQINASAIVSLIRPALN